MHYCSKVVRMVDENGLAVILKDNKPRYVVLDFDEYDEIRQAGQLREQKIADTADLLVSDFPLFSSRCRNRQETAAVSDQSSDTVIEHEQACVLL